MKDPSITALARLVEWTTPWLVEVGTWAFGGLIALNLVVIAALITVGPVDRAVLIAVIAFACALPFDVAGIVLLRLIKDVQEVRIDDLTLRAFQEAHFPHIEAYFPAARDRKTFTQRRARIALAYAFVIAMVSAGLTIVGLAASLWHMAPWVAETFSATVMVTVLVLMAVVVHSLPPQSEAERELRRSGKRARETVK